MLSSSPVLSLGGGDSQKIMSYDNSLHGPLASRMVGIGSRPLLAVKGFAGFSCFESCPRREECLVLGSGAGHGCSELDFTGCVYREMKSVSSIPSLKVQAFDFAVFPPS